MLSQVAKILSKKLNFKKSKTAAKNSDRNWGKKITLNILASDFIMLNIRVLKIIHFTDKINTYFLFVY